MSNKADIGLSAKPATGIVPAVAGNAEPSTPTPLVVAGLDGTQPPPAAQPPKEQKPRSFFILIRNMKKGTLHVVTKGEGVIAEFEDMEQAANVALTLPACKNNPFNLIPCYE